MDAYESIVTKRDTREFADLPIDHEVILRVLNAGRMAGSAKNRQPIRMVVLSEVADQQSLAACGDYCDWIHEAPIVVALGVLTDAGIRTHFDVGRVAQNLMIAANAEGLASCPVTLARAEQARELLELDEGYEVPMALAIGHPRPSSGERRSHPRHPLDDIVIWR